jgi:carbon monoxide dehydrogenase subunit G
VRLIGSHRVAAPPQRVWAALLDAEILAGCLPGCERLEPDGADGYTTTMSVGVGSIRGRYSGRVDITDRREPEAYVMRVEGRGLPGFVRGTVAVTLVADADETIVEYDADGQVGGVIAGVGQRMITGVGRMLADQFFACVAARVTGEPDLAR